MGGIGSGRCGSRRKAEDCFGLDVNQLYRWGCLKTGYNGSCTWNRHGRSTARISLKSNGRELFLFPDLEALVRGICLGVVQCIPIVQVPCTKGGTRPYFRCSGHPNGQPCGRRIGKLFLAQRCFLCRHCQRISYASQSETAPDRLIRKGQKKRIALSDKPGLFRQVPKRPKGMHSRTYERRINELQHIEDQVRVGIPSRLGDLMDELHPGWQGVIGA